MDKNIDYKKDLAEKLEELKKIEGFPIGTDEDILALSEPPYYTACPNPYIKDFIEEHGTPYNEETDDYHREPFVGDVSEGKNDPTYKSYSYHTKVPYKAIINYINHYTEKGDIVFDGFSGSGMTGLAANQINRHVILNDLSSFSSVLSRAVVSDYDILKFEEDTSVLLNKISNELSWLYQTQIEIGKKKIKCEINYIIFSEFFKCNYCGYEYNHWDLAVDFENKKVKEKYSCPNCNAEISKSTSERLIHKTNDYSNNNHIEQTKREPVIICYKFQNKLRYKKLDKFDFDLLKKIDDYIMPNWFPADKMMHLGKEWGNSWRAGYHVGFEKVNHFFSKRNMIAYSFIYSQIKANPILLAGFLSTLTRGSIRNRYMPQYGNRHVGALSGTLYIPTYTEDSNVIKLFSNRIKAIKRGLIPKTNSKSFIQIGTTTNVQTIPDNSIDYIFTDPPFGDNLMYSELNFIFESWIKITTNNNKEAIINSSQTKGMKEYYHLMLNSFKEYYRVLKPKRWITVEFHNSKSKVWNVIQESLLKAGFIISNVSILDKKKGTITQLHAAGAVKSDLVISAFKPSNNFSEQFIKQAGEGLEISFINEFLTNLPVKPAIERTDKMLYSKMLAYYIQRGYEIKYDAKSFYSLLKENFVSEDGFWFTTHQIDAYLEYKKKMKLEGMDDIKSGSTLLFVNDEKSALVWLYNFLSEAKSYSDISIAFTLLANIEGDEVPELKEMLEQNFISEDGKYRRPESETEHNTITEKRQKNLRREFETLLVQAQTEKKKIKLVRKEALVYGFELCYKDKRFADILTIAKKVDKKILENSGELNDFVEAAEIMIEGIQ